MLRSRFRGEDTFFFNRLLNVVFKHSLSAFNVENVEKPVDKRIEALRFLTPETVKRFYSFYCEYFHLSYIQIVINSDTDIIIFSKES